MSRTLWTLIALLIVGAAGCGGGSDGKPVAPPTTPQAAPDPPPAPPGQPTGVRVVDAGQTFLVWAWDPVEGATSYEAEIFLPGLPPGQRGDPIITVEPTVRADGLEPGTAMEIYVRAVRETAGGRAVGPWSEFSLAETLPSPTVCTDELAQARSFHHPPRLIDEWTGMPFRFYFDGTTLPPGERESAELVFEIVGELAERIEGQIDYPLLEVGGWIRCGEWDPWRERCPRQRHGEIVAAVVPDRDEGGRAHARNAVIFWVGGRIQDAQTNGPHAWAALYLSEGRVTRRAALHCLKSKRLLAVG